MKIITFIFLSILLFISCTDDDNCINNEPDTMLIAPRLIATVDGTRNYTGPLELLPCQANSDIYIGNYNIQGNRTPFSAYYYILDGIAQSGTTGLRLPNGTYTIVYWGAPTYFTTNRGILHEPGLSIGINLSSMQYSLYSYSNDTTYHAAYELVFATQNVTIGEDSLHANLQHATAALNVTVQNTNGQAFSSAVDSMWVHIGSIAYSINAYTAIPSDQSKTVSFPLTESLDATTWSAQNISLLPSGPQPLITLFIQLNNGTIKKYSQNLTNTLSAGTLTSVTFTLNGITIESQNENFTVDNWIEQTDLIDVPPF